MELLIYLIGKPGELIYLVLDFLPEIIKWGVMLFATVLITLLTVLSFSAKRKRKFFSIMSFFLLECWWGYFNKEVFMFDVSWTSLMVWLNNIPLRMYSYFENEKWGAVCVFVIILYFVGDKILSVLDDRSKLVKPFDNEEYLYGGPKDKFYMS